MKYPIPRSLALRWPGAALLALAAMAASATDTYDTASRQLTIPSLQAGAVTLSNLVVTVGSIVGPPSGTSPQGNADSYNPVSQQLTVPAVTVAGTAYYNVVATVAAVVSIGGASGVDSYDGALLTIPTVQVKGGAVFQDVVVQPGSIVSITGGMPTASADQYDAATGHLSIPTVVDQRSGHVYTNVTVTVASIASINGTAWSGSPPLEISTGFAANGVTTTSGTAHGAWFAYLDGSGTGSLNGGAGGGYADQGVNPGYEYVYTVPTAAQLLANTYTVQGITIVPAGSQGQATTGYNGLAFTAQVNPEWLGAAGGSANFVVIVTAKVGSATGCKAAAVVAANSTAPTAYVVPFSAFTAVLAPRCGNGSITAAQILAGQVTQLDFQADGGGAAVTASGLTSNTNTTVLNQSPGAAQDYPTTLTLIGGVNLVKVGAAPAPVIVAAAGHGAANGALIVTLQDSAPGATIYYTTDGTTPDVHSPVYLAPFLVASNLSLQAFAVAPSFTNSAVSARQFAANIPSGTLVWSDEFTNTSGTPVQPDPAIWTYDTGNSGFGNGELEDYCAWGSSAAPCQATAPNAYVGTDSYLHIVARQTSPGVYTSARLKSQGLFSFQYGRFEARILVPEEQGLWPAAWLMGNNIALLNWPSCGEMDVQERIDVAQSPDVNYGSVHGPGFVGSTISSTYYFPGGQTAGSFHTYGMIWSPGAVSYYIDNPASPYATTTIATMLQYNPDATWPFDAGPNFMLLNLAVGGSWPGSPDGTTVFPAETLVDYVRIYTH